VRTGEEVAVLHVVQPTDGGVAAYVEAAAADQLARGWRVAVACPDDSPLARGLAGRRVDHVPWRASRAPGPTTADEVARLLPAVRAFGPDVVHLHSAKAGLAGRLAIRGRVPTLHQPHGWSWLAARGGMAAGALAWERFATRWTDVLVCVGEGEADLGRRHGVVGNLVVVRNGVDVRRFRPDAIAKAAARSAVGVAPDVPLAVCVGRVTRQKGQDVLLRAWPRVRLRQPAAELALVGRVDHPPPRLPGGVRLVGDVEDVLPWYHAADVVVQPSRWEGLPLSTLEALACGRPVVAANVAGLTEVVRPGVGALVAPSALAHEIARRFGDPDLARAEGLAAARLAVREFDQRSTFHRLAAITTRAAGRRKPDQARSGPHPIVGGPERANV
jgi:glycosyltransferase involved in cell wall biosynthesis